MASPGRQHFRIIFALMRAAAFGPRQRGLCNRARDDEHVAQIEPFEPLQIEAGIFRAGEARRPNTKASVMALPDNRLAPLAPPTTSPATNRPGTSVAMLASAFTPPM